MLERSLDDERALPRAWRDARAYCVSFRGYVASGCALAIAAGLGAVLSSGQKPWVVAVVTVAAGLGGLLFIVVATFAVSAAVTPTRQRDEARQALSEVVRKLAAPVELAVSFQPKPPVVLESHGSGRVYCFLNVQNNHPEDIGGVVLNFDVPRSARLTRVADNGGKYTGDGQLSGTTNRSYWMEKDLTLHGDSWERRFSFALLCTKPGTYDIVVKLRVPGFKSVERSYEFEAVPPAPQAS